MVSMGYINCNERWSKDTILNEYFVFIIDSHTDAQKIPLKVVTGQRLFRSIPKAMHNVHVPAFSHFYCSFNRNDIHHVGGDDGQFEFVPHEQLY
jgi:hypothetical protein